MQYLIKHRLAQEEQMGNMKALVKAKPEKGIWMEEVPMPEVGVNDVLIKITKAAICGTDLHIYLWNDWAAKTIVTPMTIGHEFVGVVEDYGKGVRNLKKGERVTAEGHIACGNCRNCRRGKKHVCENTIGIGIHRHGVFAQYVTVPAENVMAMHKDISDDMLAIMDPFGNATHTALSFPLIGEDVLVTGSGLIGSMCIAISRFCGARYIVATEINEFRAQMAAEMGATRVINPHRESLSDVISDLGMVGFDIGLECSGSSVAVTDMVSHMYNAGKIALLGLLPSNTTLDWEKVIFIALQIKGIYGREMFETWYMMEQMLLSGLDISPIITHQFPADSFQEGFDVMESGNCGKVILNW
jgi:threonine 3-dehydrogenase